jgi:hypothetical protein
VFSAVGGRRRLVRLGSLTESRRMMIRRLDSPWNDQARDIMSRAPQAEFDLGSAHMFEIFLVQ